MRSGSCLEDIEGRDTGGSYGRRVRGREEEGAGAVVEEVDQIARTADVAAERSDRFRESTDLNVDAPVTMKMIHCPAAVASQDARRMGIIDHHDGAVLFGEIAELIDRADVAVHREDAVGDKELASGVICDFLEQLFGVRGVFVAEDLDLGAGEAGTVDDAGVVELVGEDEVLFAEDGGDRAGVGGESGLKDDAGLDIFEGRDLFFELHVDLHGARDGADGSGADTVALVAWMAASRSLGWAAAEIVVGGEVDDLLAVVVADGRLHVVEHAQLEVGALLLQVIELGGEVLQLRALGGVSS